MWKCIAMDIVRVGRRKINVLGRCCLCFFVNFSWFMCCSTLEWEQGRRHLSDPPRRKYEPRVSKLQVITRAASFQHPHNEIMLLCLCFVVNNNNNNNNNNNIHRGNMPCIGTVSYTHLDVYKRQPQGPGPKKRNKKFEEQLWKSWRVRDCNRQNSYGVSN